MKYPWPRGDLGPGTKFGAYDDDVDVFAWVRDGAPERRPCLEAQVMDLADDVAYSVHDFEDGIQAGQIRPAELAAERDAVIAVARAKYAPTADPGSLLEAYDRLRALPYWPVDHDGTRRASAALKATTSQLIGRFCSAVEAATHERYGTRAARPVCRVAGRPGGDRHEIAVLKGVAATPGHVHGRAYRWAARRARAAPRPGRAHLSTARPTTLDPAFREDWAEARDDPARRRVVVDQVASLTDPSAVALARRLG